MEQMNMEQENKMLVSFCVIAYNEEKYLGSLFQDILNQDYDHKHIEVVLVDSMSTDTTKAMMNEFAKKYENEFFGIKVADNPKKKQSSGWNTAIPMASGDIIIRVDAHSKVTEDFVSNNVRCMDSGEDICGGPRPNLIEDSTPWKETLLLAESSMFGSSIASYRRDGERSYVKSMFHAAYRREVFKKVGGFNENLGRTEDNELHYRMRQAGYKFCFDPSINSYQYTRSTLGKMLKQKYGNGYWIGLTVGVCPGCISIFHFVPFAFIMGILLTSVLAALGIWQLGALMWSLYWCLAVVMAVVAVKGQKKHLVQLVLPGLFFLLHVSYGIGTLVGVIKMPFKRRKLKDCTEAVNIKTAMS